MKKFIPVLFILTSISSLAQDFSIKMVELTSSDVILHYDLIDTTKNRTYTVYAYSSRDNFLTPLTKISGDAGLEVKPGSNRKIVWKAKEELGVTFDGAVELEIRGRIYIPFIRLEGFDDVRVRKRDSPFLVKWTGGSRQNILNFQLYQGAKQVYTFPNVPNESQYKITIPKSVRPGKDYYFKITDAKNREQVVVTSKFDLKRKIPLALKAIPLIGVAAVVFILTKNNDGSDLEGPPSVPNGK